MQNNLLEYILQSQSYFQNILWAINVVFIHFPRIPRFPSFPRFLYGPYSLSIIWARVMSACSLFLDLITYQWNITVQAHKSEGSQVQRSTSPKVTLPPNLTLTFGSMDCFEIQTYEWAVPNITRVPLSNLTTWGIKTTNGGCDKWTCNLIQWKLSNILENYKFC